MLPDSAAGVSTRSACPSRADGPARDLDWQVRDLAAGLPCFLSATARTGCKSGGWEWIGSFEAEKSSEKAEDVYAGLWFFELPGLGRGEEGSKAPGKLSEENGHEVDPFLTARFVSIRLRRWQFWGRTISTDIL